MMPNLIEIILIIVIVVIVFGLGKLSDIGRAIGEMRAKYLEGRENGDDQTIDITPDRADNAEAAASPSQSKDRTSD
ncbi:MAG: twin-arginine translocase TatA/TatE family subunit [Myxococcota bacterium]